jgi:hypothetical protein
VVTTPENNGIAVSLIAENLYSISLTNSKGVIHDEQSLPTRITGAIAPVAVIGTSFSLNGYVINITSSSLDDLVLAMRDATKDIAINARINLNGLLEITNNHGGNIVLANITGSPVNQLGFQPTVYPGAVLAWWRLLTVYGNVKNHRPHGQDASRLLILTSEDPRNLTGALSGFIQLDPVNQNVLQWIPDLATWPSLTLPNVTAVIDPHKSWPSKGLSEAVAGQRYLLTDSIGQGSSTWGRVSAAANDIIEYDGTNWILSFDSTSSSQVEYVLNQFSQKWLKWVDGSWGVFPSQHHAAGDWQLSL